MGRASSFVSTLRGDIAPSPTVFGRLEHWIDIEIVQKLVRHTTTVVVAVVAFWLVGKLLRRLLHDGFVRRLVLLIDDFVLFVLLAFLGWEIIELMLRRLLWGNGG